MNKYTYNITFTINDENRIQCIKSETIGASNLMELMFKFQIMVVKLLSDLNQTENRKDVNDDIPF